jgi:ring-1,2-phenylacetyl-CoA epoxidase subunit PaaC
MTAQQQEALRTYLTCLADDEFILGHRMSEWTGQGPIIEEDIAFSSMAQDELGHALGFYTLLEELGAPDADALIYTRSVDAFRNSVFTELHRGDYGFSLMRQFLYDAAESERLAMLRDSSFEPLRELARKMLQEERYHWVHGTSMLKRLCGGSDEARTRMQRALDTLFPYALGLFETFEGHDDLVEAGIIPSEIAVRDAWMQRICPLFKEYGLSVPCRMDGGTMRSDAPPVEGGRAGRHTEHLDEILGAVQMLAKRDPGAKW